MQPGRDTRTAPPTSPSRREALRLAAIGALALPAVLAGCRDDGVSDGGNDRPTPGPGSSTTTGSTAPARPSRTVYVADRANNRIRAVAPDGSVTTVAGGPYGRLDGDTAAARFAFPFAVALAPDATIYVADQANNQVRAVRDGKVVTIAGSGAAGAADGPALEATFDLPFGLVVADDGTVYIADVLNHRIRAITPGGQVRTVSGAEAGRADGASGAGRFNEPAGVALTADGRLLVADRANHRICTVSADGAVATLAGDGRPGVQDGMAGRFNRPTGIAVGPDGTAYVADTIGHSIRAVSPEGEVSTIAGSGAPGFADGQGVAAQFSEPCGVAIDPSGLLVVADRKNHRIRLVSTTGRVTTLAGTGGFGFADGPATVAQFDEPYGVATA